jgi:hypothetical protein
VASSSGTAVLIVVGLIAVGFASGGDDSDTGTADGSDEFSFEASASASANDDLFDEPSGDDDDFSFEPDGGVSGSSTDGDDGDGEDGGDGGSGCEDVVIVNEGSAEVDVPGESRIFQESTVDCSMSEGDDGEAVATLQDALVRCNGQSIAVDGEYGPATTQAVASVQARNGITADGMYGPATMRAMSWPAGDGCTEVA